MKCVLSKFVAALGASMLLLAPMTASAQSDGSAEASLFTTGYLSSYLGVYSTYIGIPITTTGGVVVLVVVLLKDDKSAALENYLNINRDEIQTALYLGDSQAGGAKDLAHLFGVSVEHEDAFAELLFQERDVLGALIDEEHISSKQAFTFAQHIVTKMQAHQDLSLDVQRQLDAYYAAQ